ncbi:MAG TPA: helix-turn-helix transcriptional regulator [Novosphingobium sp.]|nr:helix-turn-helix transcriptional regulator [Novosphingobium sp.]
MAVAAHFETPDAGAGRARGARRTLRLETHGASATGAAAVLIHNISATGLLLESDTPIAAGETIEIDLPLVGMTPGRAVWSSGKLIGCRFDAPLSTAALSAAQLRSAVAPEVAERGVSGEAPPDDDTLGARLQRLRKARGLSLDQLAARLGVSKPTIWAWEHGRARPIESRIEALAEALEVERSELVLADDRSERLRALLGKVRLQLAVAAATSPEKIRIMIEL